MEKKISIWWDSLGEKDQISITREHFYDLVEGDHFVDYPEPWQIEEMYYIYRG